MLNVSCALIDGVTETKKHETKKQQESGILGALIAPLASSMLGSMLIKKGVLTAGKGVGAGRGYNIMDHIDNNF